MEKVLDEISFEGPDLKKKNVKIDAAYVRKQLADDREGPGPEPVHSVSMPNRTRRFPLAIVCAALAGCGYVGEPRPPSLHIPSRIEDLRAFQREDKLIVHFSLPALTTDGEGIKRLVDAELRIGPEGGDWAAGARRIEAGTLVPGPVHLAIPAGEWVGRAVLLRARAAGRKGRFSEWSNPVRLSVLAPLQPPADVKVEGVASGVRVAWAAPPGCPGSHLARAPRRAGPGEAGTARAVLQAGIRRFHRAVRQDLPIFGANGDEGRRRGSRERGVQAGGGRLHLDRFPPAVPAGLTAVAGVGSIQLVWNPDTDPDLKGYYMFRSAGDQPFARLGELLDSPSYTDRAIEGGQRYRYAVSAIDQSGNESARSAPLEVIAQ